MAQKYSREGKRKNKENMPIFLLRKEKEDSPAENSWRLFFKNFKEIINIWKDLEWRRIHVLARRTCTIVFRCLPSDHFPITLIEKCFGIGFSRNRVKNLHQQKDC
jgi:hypothetical protein